MSGFWWILVPSICMYFISERPQVSKREVLLMVERGDCLSESLQFGILIAGGLNETLLAGLWSRRGRRGCGDLNRLAGGHRGNFEHWGWFENRGKASSMEKLCFVCVWWVSWVPLWNGKVPWSSDLCKSSWKISCLVNRFATHVQALIWTDFLPWNWKQTYQVWKEFTFQPDKIREISVLLKTWQWHVSWHRRHGR